MTKGQVTPAPLAVLTQYLPSLRQKNLVDAVNHAV